MKFFNYTAVTSEGKTIRGVMEAVNEESATNLLEQGGLYPINLAPGSDIAGNIKKIITGKKVKHIEIVEFAQNLSVMLRAGVSIITALEDIIETTENQTFANILVDIKNNVESGARFTDSIERHGSVFPNVFVRLLRVGEETGQFDSSLADVAEHLKNVAEVAAAIKQALIYPFFAILTTLGALMFWMVYVLPKMITVIKGLGVKIPLMTRALMITSVLTQKYWYLILIIPVAVLLTLRRLNQKPSTRYYLDEIKLKLPVVKLIVLNKTLALFSEQMRILIRSGLTIDKTLNMVADVIGNEVYRRSLLRVRESVMLGGFISASLKAEKIYPTLVIRMISIGEQSGTLDNQFEFLSEHYRKKLKNISANLGKIIEPLVIIIIGLLLGVIMLALMLPLYDMVSSMGKM